jgi:hypothetical protein
MYFSNMLKAIILLTSLVPCAKVDLFPGSVVLAEVISNEGHGTEQ